MNKIIENLPLISSALEHYDSKTGGAWHMRNTLISMAVWAAHALVKLGYKPINPEGEPLNPVLSNEMGASPAELAAMRYPEDDERIPRAKAKFAILLEWARDANAHGFPIDFSRNNIRKTLGLERDVDLRKEALKLAREKCGRANSAHRFEEFYYASLESVEEQHRLREAMVDGIEDLIHNGANLPTPDEDDEYAADAIQLQTERLEETVLSAVERAWNLAQFELKSSCSPTKIKRIAADIEGLEKMLGVLGVKKNRFEQRAKVLDEDIKGAEAKLQTRRRSSEQACRRNEEGEG